MNYLTLYPWLCFLPAFISMVLALLTKNVILSLFSGILAGAFIQNDFFSQEFFCYLYRVFSAKFVMGSKVNFPNITLMLFFWILGIFVYLMQRSGYMKAFSGFLGKKLKSRKAGQLFILFLGLGLFIDDYFKILAIGSVACAFCDRLCISREKLAYFLDVTAAPVCVLIPISSWGASIIATLNGIIEEQGIADCSGLELFLWIALCNWYAILSLLLVLIMVWVGFDFERMRSCEFAATKMKLKGEVVKGTRREAIYFILPVVVLTVITVIMVLVTGMRGLKVSEEVTLLNVIDGSENNFSMVVGGIVAIGIAFYLRRQPVDFIVATKQGFSTMFPSMTTLFFSWALSQVIEDLNTGQYLARLIKGIPYLSAYYLPFFFFLIAGGLAFSSGSSWGTFGILLPIVAQISVEINIELLVPLMAASIGGAVFGDHASPISDTSILSSVAAGCDHVEHIATQLPYTLFVAGITLFGYLVFGITHNLFISSIISIASLHVCICGYYWFYVRKGLTIEDKG